MDSEVVVSAAARAAALWRGLNLFLYLVLAVLVTRQRQRHHVLIGDGDLVELARPMRAFGNAAEYVPAALLVLALLAMLGAHPLVVHGMGALLLVARVLHGVGLSNNEGVSFGRTSGAVLTWLYYLLSSALLIFYCLP
jgi:uncharacterized membrane protein YecN with MAPEG domain